MNKEELFNNYLKECENICMEYQTGLALHKLIFLLFEQLFQMYQFLESVFLNLHNIMIQIIKVI